MMRAASSPLEPLNKNILLAGEVIAEKWKIGEKIGEGTFSQIYSAYSIESRDKVAVKVEAPSALKPVLEWESLILKSLQDCPYVCRYFYHGKHGDSTVLVMELLGESMSMLRMSPDSIHGVPLAKSVSVGLEMLDCIEAFHRHGYVHRDIKASNFALSAVERHLQKQQRYFIIDFGLSRQHIGEDRQVLPARPVAEFRGTSMYASLSSHRRQELGPKDDLWSWFYLVMDFLRGELPWATDAQLKNRQTVLSLKEHYTELNPGLLVEGLPGAMQLLEMMDYLQSLKYEDLPDYAKIRKQLQAVRDSSLVLDNSDSGGEEVYAYKKASHVLTPASEIDWDAIDSERERALTWTRKADELTNGDGASHMLLAIAKRYKTFFDSDGLSLDERVRVQSAVYHIEKKLRTRSSFLAPPPIQSFVKRRQSEQKMRSDALRKRREKDLVVRQSLEIKNDERMFLTQGSREELPGVGNGEGTTKLQSGMNPGLVPPERFMADLGSEVVSTRQKDNWPEAAVSTSNHQGSLLDERHYMASRPQHQLPYTMPLTSPTSQRDRIPNHGGAVPPPLPSPGMSSSSKRLGAFEHRFPPPLPGPANSHKPLPPAGFPPNDASMHRPPPSPRSAVPEHRYTSAPVRHQSASVETRSDGLYSYQRSLKSPRKRSGLPSTRPYTSETREDRGYSAQGIQKSPREFVPSRHHDASKETRDDHDYSRYQCSQNSPLASDRRFDSKREIRDDRGYGSYHYPSRGTEVSIPDARYGALTTMSEDRGYGPRKAQEPSSRERHEQYQSGGVYKYPEKEHYSEGKRSRSHSRSPRHGERHYRSRSYSRSSSRSRSRSLSYSGSSSRSRSSSRHSRSHRRTDHYADRHPVTRREDLKRGHPSRQRSRSRSSSRSSSSMSASPPTKHYRRRSPEPSRSESSRRRSSHVTSSHRSYSNEGPKEYVNDHTKEYVNDHTKEYVNDHTKEYAKGYSKEYVDDHPKVYPKGYPKEYVNDRPKKYVNNHTKEYTKGYPKEYVGDHPKEYVKSYPKKYVNDHPKEYVKGYQNEYVGNAQERVKSYPKEHGIEYPETYPSKSYPPEHDKDYRRRSPLPEGRNPYLQQPQYRHSPSPNRHSLSREHGRGNGSWAVETRAKPIAAPDKHRRSTRWQPRP